MYGHYAKKYDPRITVPESIANPGHRKLNTATAGIEDVVDRGMKEFRSSIVAADQQPRPPSGTNDPERLQPYTETSQGAAKPTKGALVAAGLK